MPIAGLVLPASGFPSSSGQGVSFYQIYRFTDSNPNISESPKIRLEYLGQVPPSSKIFIQAGVAAQIDCIIEKGNPEPSIKWTKKGQDEDVLSTGLSLIIDDPTEEDQATYCVEV